MRFLLLVLLVACHEDEPKAEFRASCKPAASNDAIECVVENVGKRPGRACLTAREQPPKKPPLIAKRLCTKVLAPGEKSATLAPKFADAPDLQPICAPDGTWVCKGDIVEKPHELGDNIPDGK